MKSIITRIVNKYRKNAEQEGIPASITQINRPCVSQDKEQYASFAGKQKMKEEYKHIISQKHFDKHEQYYCDFYFKYKNPNESCFFMLGILTTDYTDEQTINVSKKINFEGKSANQNLLFFKEPIMVKSDFFLDKKSYTYFKDTNIRNNIENTELYAKAKAKAMEYLKSNNIEFSEITNRDSRETGFYTYIKKYYPDIDVDKEIEKESFIKLYKLAKK